VSASQSGLSPYKPLDLTQQGSGHGVKRLPDRTHPEPWVLATGAGPNENRALKSIYPGREDLVVACEALHIVTPG